MKVAKESRHAINRLWLGTILLPFGFVLAVEAFEAAFLQPRLPTATARAITAFILLAGIVLFSLAVFRLLHRAREQEREALMAARRNAEQLEVLREAGLISTAELAIDTVLQKVVDLSRQVTGARYGALAVYDGEKPEAFITSGVDPEMRRRIGRPPSGHGVLGLILQEGRAVRLADVTTHPAFEGFPPGHMLIRSFLGAPIRYQGRVLGNLYLGEKANGEAFTAEDEQALERLAAQAAIAIANARLYARLEDMAVLQERQRISMELHDGTIQSLFALGLRLEECLEEVGRDDEAVRRRLDAAIEELGRIGTEIRRYIFDLEERVPDGGRDIEAELRGLIEALQLERSLRVRLAVDEVARRRAAPLTVRSGVIQIAREALTNVVKHARATSVEVVLRAAEEELELLIRDDGVGFDPARQRDGGHRGLRNMANRASRCGGTLRVESAPGKGTTVAVRIPLPGDEETALDRAITGEGEASARTGDR